MSIWINLEDRDIDVEMDEEEVQIVVGGNNLDGNIWAVITFDQITKINKMIKEVKSGSLIDA